MAFRPPAAYGLLPAAVRDATVAAAQLPLTRPRRPSAAEHIAKSATASFMRHQAPRSGVGVAGQVISPAILGRDRRRALQGCSVTRARGHARCY